LLRSSSFQRVSGAPWKKKLLPLSARIIPYFFIAVRMTWLAAEKPEMLTLALRRTRMPMMFILAEDDPAAWLAG